jgi:hypothetical protein
LGLEMLIQVLKSLKYQNLVVLVLTNQSCPLVEIT